MTAAEGSTGPDADTRLGDQFKEAEAEAKPYVGTDDDAGGDDRNDDAVAAGADPDEQDQQRSDAEMTQTGLPGVGAATGLRRG